MAGNYWRTQDSTSENLTAQRPLSINYSGITLFHYFAIIDKIISYTQKTPADILVLILKQSETQSRPKILITLTVFLNVLCSG